MPKEDTTTYESVLFQKKEGTLILSGSSIAFQTGEKSLTLPWASIEKHQINPKSHEKALLKLVPFNGEPAKTFQLPTREDLEKVNQDISDRLEKHQKESVNNSENKSGKTPDDSIYKHVQFKGVEGTLRLLEKNLQFASEADSKKTYTLSWSKISKQQASPPKVTKSILKIFKQDGTFITFQVSNRDELDKLYKDIDNRRRQHQSNDSKTDVRKAESSDTVYTNIQQKSTTGTLTLTNEYISFQSKESTKIIRWNNISKYQGNPPSHAKVLIKISLTDDNPVIFQIPDRETLEKLKSDVAARMKNFTLQEGNTKTVEKGKGEDETDEPSYSQPQEAIESAPANDTENEKQSKNNVSHEEVTEALPEAPTDSEIKETENDKDKLDESFKEVTSALTDVHDIFDESFASLMSDTSFMADEDPDEDFSVVTLDTRLPDDKDATKLPPEYKNVIYKSRTGRITFTKDHLLFQPAQSKHPQTGGTKIQWKDIEKHHGSPPKHAKAMVKIILTGGKDATFTLPNRRDLELIRMDITSRLHEYRKKNKVSGLGGLVIKTDQPLDYIPSYKKVPPGAKSTIAYYPVHFQQSEGSLFLSWDQLSFQPSGVGSIDNARTVFWDSIADHQVPEDKNLTLKITLNDGSHLAFKFKHHKDINKCAKDAEYRIGKYEEFEHVPQGTEKAEENLNSQVKKAPHVPPARLISEVPKSPLKDKTVERDKDDSSEGSSNMQSLLNLSFSLREEDDEKEEDLFLGVPPPPPPPPLSPSRSAHSSGSSSASSPSSSSSRKSSSSSEEKDD